MVQQWYEDCATQKCSEPVKKTVDMYALLGFSDYPDPNSNPAKLFEQKSPSGAAALNGFGSANPKDQTRHVSGTSGLRSGIVSKGTADISATGNDAANPMAKTNSIWQTRRVSNKGAPGVDLLQKAATGLTVGTGALTQSNLEAFKGIFRGCCKAVYTCCCGRTLMRMLCKRPCGREQRKF